jgi:hypothetical protein
VKARLIDLADRAVNTFAQGALSVLAGNSLNVWDADWKAAVGVGVGGAILSVLSVLRTWRTRA